MLLDQEYTSSMCEIKTMENELIATGILSEITKDQIEIVAKVGNMPIAEFGTQVKVNIYNSKLGFKVLTGQVYTSSYHFIRLMELDFLVDYERRHFFRVDISMRTNIKLAENEETDKDIQPIPVEVTNISLSGVGFITAEKLEKDKIYSIVFKMMRKTCDLQFTIAREFCLRDGSFQYGCQFEQMSTMDGDILCAFIFERQREQISRQRLELE